ncbi:hypothetical protein [Streptomyces avicenniae]|uniref:hypothetical protein n=1 Tax=Streptomyces avicenniae TaxID=500153 RepID=UPI00069C66DA|nr:hypothetical protein [Streptomyces avicenniae]
MHFVRTTPPRPIDVTAAFPELAPLARTAIRLHPRPGSPSVSDSSVGGPLLWPAAEPWPHCDATHEGTGWSESPAMIRLVRRRLARLHRDPDGPAYTPEEEAIKERIDAGPPQPVESPVPLLPVAQLYLRDIPLLRPPGQADLLQVLWCPHDHDDFPKPATALFWRSAAEVGGILAAPPEPKGADYDGYVPDPCLLAPEEVTEYPNYLDLSQELRELLEDPSRWQALGADLGSLYAGYEDREEYEEHPEAFYNAALGDSPGWKVGGWPPWGRTDPYPRHCAVCEARMVPLLTIASFEWSGSSHGWAPLEEQAAATARSHVAGQSPAQPTHVEVGSADNMQIYVCPASPEHPHTDLIQ